METLQAVSTIWVKTLRAELRLLLVAKDENEPWRRPRADLVHVKGRLASDMMELAEGITDKTCEGMVLCRTWADLSGSTAAALVRLMLGVILDLNITLSSAHYMVVKVALEIVERIWEAAAMPLQEWRRRWAPPPAA